jgi:hypothetical protein
MDRELQEVRVSIICIHRTEDQMEPIMKVMLLVWRVLIQKHMLYLMFLLVVV